MLLRLHDVVRSDYLVVAYVAAGFGINSLLHLYRFYKVDWTHVTGLLGRPQSIALSFALCAWILLPIALSRHTLDLMRSYKLALFLVPVALLVLNELSGRSILKLCFDILLVAILCVWLLIDYGYAGYIEAPPSAEARPFVVTELLTLFQITLAILTFVIATFGFSFAPAYVERYYHHELGQPTTWWFGIMAMYLSLGVAFFVALQAWVLAVRLRAPL